MTASEKKPGAASTPEQEPRKRAQVLLQERLQGQSLAQIGRRHQLSRERVRQLLVEHFPDQVDEGKEATAAAMRARSAQRRDRLLTSARQWAQQHRHFTVQQLQEAVPATRVDRTWLRKHFADQLVYPSLSPLYTDAQIIEFLRQAGTRVQGPLSKRAYEQVRESHWATSVTVINRLGWNDALRQAGLSAYPIKRTYRRIDVDQIHAWVRRYLNERPGGTMTGYEAWSREHPLAPSGSTVRKRYRRWHELKAEIERDAAG